MWPGNPHEGGGTFLQTTFVQWSSVRGILACGPGVVNGQDCLLEIADEVAGSSVFEENKFLEGRGLGGLQAFLPVLVLRHPVILGQPVISGGEPGLGSCYLGTQEVWASAQHGKQLPWQLATCFSVCHSPLSLA